MNKPIGSLPQAAALLDIGEQAPQFGAPVLDGNPAFSFDSVAGRPILMLFMGSGRAPESAAALALVQQHEARFDDVQAMFFGVTVDPTDAAEGRIARRIPGIRWFLDYDGAVSRTYGAMWEQDGRRAYAGYWLLLDPLMRCVARAPIADGVTMMATLRAYLDTMPEQVNAPVLKVPRIFEPELCRELISLYEGRGGQESGFMREENGMTVGKVDHSFKRRRDCDIEGSPIRTVLLDRLRRRLVPQISKAFQFAPTRIERWIVACYDAAEGGHFRPHRDNTTAGTAHRAFACTINLNAEDYDGGELRFPEFGQATYRAPTGGAVIFSCSLLHEATPVTRGKRYAFLPFLYDEARAELRTRNRQYLAPTG